MTQETVLSWVKCSKRLPRPRTWHFTPVLFAVRGTSNPVCAGRYFTKLRQFVSLQGAGYNVADVTHWAHMPKAPESTDD